MLKNEIMAHCRLCLVKDDVNIAIFDNLQEICQKISSCLPVKVSKDDKLPKKICDGCNLKLEQFYEFVTASVQAERQLLEWLKDEASASSKADVRVKEELFEQQNAFEETVQAEYVDFKTKHTEDSAKEPPRKRARKAAVKVKPTLSQETDEEDDDLDTVAKVEDESADNSEQEESYEEVPGTSADDQPGPSGLSKGESEAPYLFSCVDCPKTYHLASSLRRHMHTHQLNYTPPVYACKLCTKKYNRKNTLTRHIRDQHEWPRQHACHICPATYLSSHSLRHHVKTHVNLRPFACTQCDKRFQEKATLVVHMRIHTKERPYCCDICGKKFTQSGALFAHKRRHGGKTPYNCVECGRSMASLWELKRHRCVEKA